MTVSRLLKSWATPPATWPTASMRWARTSWSSSCRRTVRSAAITTTPSTDSDGVLEPGAGQRDRHLGAVGPPGDDFEVG